MASETQNPQIRSADLAVLTCGEGRGGVSIVGGRARAPLPHWGHGVADYRLMDCRLGLDVGGDYYGVFP